VASQPKLSILDQEFPADRTRPPGAHRNPARIHRVRAGGAWRGV